jgi:hypothetical protein
MMATSSWVPGPQNDMEIACHFFRDNGWYFLQLWIPPSPAKLVRPTNSLPCIGEDLAWSRTERRKYEDENESSPQF